MPLLEKFCSCCCFFQTNISLEVPLPTCPLLTGFPFKCPGFLLIAPSFACVCLISSILQQFFYLSLVSPLAPSGDKEKNVSIIFQNTSRNCFVVCCCFFFFSLLYLYKVQTFTVSFGMNTAFSEFANDFQTVWNVFCLWQTSWEIYECNTPPVLQGSLNKLTCQRNKNEQQAAVRIQGPYKTAKGQEVLEINNL